MNGFTPHLELHPGEIPSLGNLLPAAPHGTTD